MREIASRGFILSLKAPFGYRRITVKDGRSGGRDWRSIKTPFQRSMSFSRRHFAVSVRGR